MESQQERLVPEPGHQWFPWTCHQVETRWKPHNSPCSSACPLASPTLCPLPSQRCLSHGCQISSSATLRVTSGLPAPQLLPNGERWKNIQASIHGPTKIKVLHKIDCISLEFSSEETQTNKQIWQHQNILFQRFSGERKPSCSILERLFTAEIVSGNS